MLRTLMHAKLHGARVTEHNLAYQGSITLDRELMDAVGILPNEKVQIVNKNNGVRFETYVFEGPAGNGDVCVNGAAARLVSLGDEILVIAYGLFSDDDAKNHTPKVAFLSPENKIVEQVR
ncbi:MAG: aspartate 1-decarboxylase [Planctomycetota bacterium]|nr:aspartate 1-decarboxylase [Planctomycetota bacterium]